MTYSIPGRSIVSNWTQSFKCASKRFAMLLLLLLIDAAFSVRHASTGSDINHSGRHVVRTKEVLGNRTQSILAIRENSPKHVTATLSDRQLQQEESSTRSTTYWEATDFGSYDPMMSIGNPMKGLTPNPNWATPPYKNNIPNTLEFFYIGLDDVMIGNNIFNWTVFDNYLKDSALRKKHAIPRFFIHFPGEALRLPRHLIGKIKLYKLSNKDSSPDYRDSVLQEALFQFITALGKQYDGDQRVYCFQAGLLGFWGEWHTYPHTFLLPESVKDTMLQLFDTIFTKSHIQIRDPMNSATGKSMIGFHDDSFTYSTLDGEYNGGQYVSWYFWPKIKSTSNTNFWKTSIMGGETRPENQADVFRSDYQVGTETKQSFETCTQVTHASWMLMQVAFSSTIDSTYLENALKSHSTMGYNYRVRKVTATASTTTSDTQFINLQITIEQVGVAPFYFPLEVAVSCDDGTDSSKRASGVEQLIEQYTSKTFEVNNIPASIQCLATIKIFLTSSNLYDGTIVKFAQSGSEATASDGTVRLKIPLPNDTGVTTSTPKAKPTTKPAVKRPTKPVRKPVRKPIRPKTVPKAAPTKTWTSSTSIIKFDLYNSKTNEKISTLDNGSTIKYSKTGSDLCIVLDVSDLSMSSTITNVVFRWIQSGKSFSHTENGKPYCVPGNTHYDYNTFKYLQIIGSKSITATVYNSTQAILSNSTIDFTVTS